MKSSVFEMDLGLKQERDLKELFEVESGAFASGLFASVKRARSRRTGQLFAAKHSPKRKENYNEVRLLSKLISPYIISFKDAFETSAHVVVIMEFAPGGDMQSLIDADVILNESHASRYIHQLLQGLAYLHSKSIAHLDIKPQNLLMMGDFPNRDSIIKICDFELSRVIHPNREEREIVGTPDYVAPEILQYDPLSLKADIWSTGIVVYVLLTGFSPFGGETDTETFNNIIHNEIDFPSEIFDDVVSAAGIEFIGWLCQKNVSSRPTAATALQHVWLKSSRLSSRKKGMSKSTYDLTKGKGREKITTEKTRLRKSKSREQLWRSKIHLSLSSEKIERWASVASFSYARAEAAAALNGNGRRGKNIRVHSEESLMTMTLPTATMDSKDTLNVQPELASNPRPLYSNGSSSRHGSINNSNGLLRSDPLRPPAHEENGVGIKLLSRARLEELSPGDKIKETVGEDEVQKSVAELISKFGGTHMTTKKHGKGGGSSTATNSSVNLDPIEELDDQENNDNSLTGVIESVQQQSGRQGLRKSIASNSSGSSSGGSRSSSTTTIDDIKATLAQLLPLSILTPPPVSSPLVPTKGSRTQGGQDSEIALDTPQIAKPEPVPATKEEPIPASTSQVASTNVRKTSTSFYVPLKGTTVTSQPSPNVVPPFPRTRRRPSSTSASHSTTSTTSEATSTSSPVVVTTAAIIPRAANVARKPTNRFTTRCEVRISGPTSTNVSTSTTRPTPRTTIAKAPNLATTARMRARGGSK